MLKDIRRKVMQIANRLVGQGQIRRNAMLTAWKNYSLQSIEY